MVLPCMCQKLLWPSNATYNPHVPISSCTHMRQLCHHICFIRIICNEQCDLEHSYTYISYYCHMPLNKYAFDIEYICPTVLLLWSIYRLTLLYIQVQKQQSATGTPHIIAKHVPETNMLLKCHMPITSCADETTMSVYIPHMNSLQSTVQPDDCYIFHIIGICPE